MTFRHPVTVYWEDTDAGGIVYHSNYLKFAERARTEMVAALGIDQRALADDGRGHVFAVRRAAIDFKKPARLLDRLEVETEVTAAGGASLELVQTIRRLDGAEILVRLDIQLAYISLEGRPARIPADLRVTLHSLAGERR